jgi:PhnB protein
MASFPPPEGHHTITPGFMVPNAAGVIKWIERAFDGRVVDLYEGPGGAIMHAEVMIGDCVVMLGDLMPGSEPMPAMLSYYVDGGEAVDKTYARALEAGASSVSEPADQFYGYRSACVKDIGGNRWTICAVVEQLSREEMQARMAKMGDGGHG